MELPLNHFILNSQNWLVSASPGLIPLLGIGFSFLNSWHCSLMCSPFLSALTPAGIQAYFWGRILSYSSVGVLFSLLGKSLRVSGLSESLAVTAHLFFVVLVLLFLLSSLIPKLKFLKFVFVFIQTKLKAPGKNSNRSFVLGMASVALPCPLLYLMFSVALSLANPLIAGVVLFNHAVATMPALSSVPGLSHKVQRYFQFLSNSKGKSWALHATKLLRWALIALMLLNLMAFTGRFFFPEGHQSKILFCF